MGRRLLGGLGRGVCLIALGISGGAVAYGQAAVSPSVLDQVPQASPLPHILPKAPPHLGRSLPNFQPLGVEGSVPHAAVPVRSAAVIGATVFPAAVLDRTIGQLTGPSVPLARVEAARLRLVSLYRDHGYVLTAVSAEINAAGDLRFIVTEGHIVTIKLSRDIGPVGSLVLAFLDHLTHERPVREASLEHWLLLAEEIPGVSVNAVLERNDAAPGALTLVAEVHRQAVSGLLTADNRGFHETGPAEGLAVVDINSVTALGDQTQISLFHTSGSTNNFGQAAESFYVGASGLRIGFYAGAGRAQPSGVLREIGYRSYLEVFGLNASYPLLLRRGNTLDAKLSLDGTQNLIDTASGLGGGEAATSSDSVRAVRFALNEAFTDDALGGDRVGLTTASLQLSKGLSILGASANGRVNAGRIGENFDFFKLDAAVERTQTLFDLWRGASVALQGGFGGQYTPDVLPSSEEFYLGGNRITQGYYSGEVTGDKALYASAEVQLNTPIALAAFGRRLDLGSQFYGFYDYGENWQNGALAPGERPNNYRLASAGIGARFRLTAQLEFDIEGVHRFVTQLQPAGSGVAALSGTAVYWGVLARY
ncbi:ShlB/FhaC/HecB family hemolysin secretion/activation protein [Acidiphilium sp.]|uniref:ShlB/FhaC/HecB family hemolysin secretion/activation protein n=1 Tax=Acidiphilium sp. TaxID=527 RepID=UPI003D062599